MPLRAALTGTALAATFLLAVVEPAVAQNVVSDIALAGGDSERVVFTSPANPTAILLCLPAETEPLNVSEENLCPIFDKSINPLSRPTGG
jgi:hypothetical protein